MNTITAADIARDPESFLRRIEAGEPLLVVRGQTPLAEVKPLPIAGEAHRPFGLCAGHFTVPADFNDPLPEALLRGFEGR